MKKAVFGFVLSLIATVAISTPAHATDLFNQMFLQQPSFRGGEVPFPFGQEIVFPWNAIEGVWQIEDAQVSGYFSFQVARDLMGATVLKVIQIESTNGRVIGQGAGFANETQKVVRAVMKGKDSNYLVFVRVFRNLRIHNRVEQQATVLSVRTFGTRVSPEREWHFLLHKINSRPVQMRTRN